MMLTDEQRETIILRAVERSRQMGGACDLVAKAIERATLEAAADGYWQEFHRDNPLGAAFVRDWLRSLAQEIPQC